MEQKLAYNVVFSNHIDNKKSAQQVGLGYHEVFGLVRWPKKNCYQKNSSNEPKIDYMEQKMAFKNLFSYQKSAQQVGLGYHEVFGLVQWPQKIVTKKTAQMSPKLTIWSKKWPSTFFFHTEKSAQQVGLG